MTCNTEEVMQTMTAFSTSERRGFGRREISVAAKLSVPGRGLLPCVVRNVSEGGALLLVDGEIKLPANVRLIIDEQGVDVMCEVRRTGPDGIGVRFHTPVPALTMTLPAASAPAAPAAPPLAQPPKQPISSRTLRGLMERPLRPRREPKIVRPADGKAQV